MPRGKLRKEGIDMATQFKRLAKGCCGTFWLGNPAMETIIEAVLIRFREKPNRTRFEQTRKVLEQLKQEQLVSELHAEFMAKSE
jgi:hypothetical protein